MVSKDENALLDFRSLIRPKYRSILNFIELIVKYIGFN